MLRHRSIATKRYCPTSLWEDLQAVGHMRASSDDRDGLAASKSEEQKLSPYARPGQVYFDERRYKLATLAVGSFGCLGKEGSDLINGVAESIVAGTDGSSLARKGVCAERLFKRVSGTTQVAFRAECAGINWH